MVETQYTRYHSWSALAISTVYIVSCINQLLHPFSDLAQYCQFVFCNHDNQRSGVLIDIFLCQFFSVLASKDP